MITEGFTKNDQMIDSRLIANLMSKVMKTSNNEKDGEKEIDLLFEAFKTYFKSNHLLLLDSNRDLSLVMKEVLKYYNTHSTYKAYKYLLPL
jgi:hypothetical protein